MNSMLSARYHRRVVHLQASDGVLVIGDAVRRRGGKAHLAAEAIAAGLHDLRRRGQVPEATQMSVLNASCGAQTRPIS
ncbi:hypothetical protein M8494_05555 [Serratia ureilytica]